jgi:Na+/H+ antiporter NhaD/arsenite permease-like protein
MNQQAVVLILLAATFGLILYRRVPIHYVSLAAAALLILLGIVPPGHALTRSINWSVLSIYFGYGMLAAALRESRMPAFLASWVLPRLRKEKFALFFLCTLAGGLSSFMANPVVVLILAPLAIELAERLEGSLFLYLIALAVSSNVVTTVTMVADPPALILAMSTGMGFLDFYWFRGRPGLGTLSVLGVAVALLTLLFQFRRLNRTVDIQPGRVDVSWAPTVLFLVSVLALALPPTSRHPGLVGLALGAVSLLLLRGRARSALVEFDLASILFLIGIFILIDSVDRVGLLEAFAAWLPRIGLARPATALLLITWLSVALSSFIDNVPYTVLMIPTCTYLAQALGIGPCGLYFGMLVGTGIGGNITPVGATANVLAAGILEKRGVPVRLGAYLKISLPLSFAAVAVSHLLIQIFWM